jgi:branched-chain amino acid transport system substrate-binding protein
MRWNWIWVSVVAMGFPLVTGCNKQSGSSGDAKEIVIGQVASLTGDTATFGVSADEGVRLALDEINGGSKVLGKPIKLVTEDDRSTSDEAKTAAEKLINRDHAVAIIGEIASSRSIAMAPVCQDAKVPMLSPGSTNPKVTEVGDYIFRACFIDPFQGKAMAEFALNNLKLKRFGMLYAVNSDYSVGLKDYVMQAVNAGGGQIVDTEAYTEKNDKDFRSQLTKIRDHHPDAIFVTGYYQEAGLIARQARDLGINVPLIGGDGWDSDQLVKVGGQAIDGCYFTNHYSPDEQRPEVQAFVTAYKAKYKNPDGTPKVPDAMAILGYDAMKLMAHAINQAGSTDGQKIRDALAATKNFPAAAGSITIDENRNAIKPIVVIKIVNGQFTYVASVQPGK